MRLVDGYRTDVLYSIRKENGWEGVKMELLMTNEKISGIIGGEKIPVHTEFDSEAGLMEILSLTRAEKLELLRIWKEHKMKTELNASGGKAELHIPDAEVFIRNDHPMIQPGEKCVIETVSISKDMLIKKPES